MKVRFLISFTALLVFSPAAFTAGCGGGGEREQGEVRVAVADPSSYRLFPYHVGRGLGLFEAEGVEVELVDAGDEAGALERVADGEAELAIVGADTLVPALARGEELDPVYGIAAGSDQSFEASCGVCTTSASVRLKRVEDLAGKTVAVAGEDAELQLELLLRSAGLDLTDIELHSVADGAEAAQSIEAGESDAYIGPDEASTEIESTSLGPGDLVPSATFVARPGTMDDLGGEGTGFLRGWSRATAVGLLNDPVTDALVPDSVSGGSALGEATLDAEPAGTGGSVSGTRGGKAYAFLTPRGADIYGSFDLAAWSRFARLTGADGLDLESLLEPHRSGAVNDWDRTELYCLSRRWEFENLDTIRPNQADCGPPPAQR